MAKSEFSKRRGLALQGMKKRARPEKLAVPEVSAHERDAASFWYRRIATSLLIGNGAGVIAVAGFIGKTDDLPFAASIAYPTLTLFLTGVAFGFGSLFISLFWAALRIETYSDFHTKLAALGGLTNAQIAEQLGIRPKTVEWRMTKALAHCAAQYRR